ncbi:hypothetical protein EKL32_26930 [Flavobacterium sp. GSN2]|nr:hypothetical protein EKL32_26930 [Flavobacterium sp. GSN2]
MSTVSTQNPNNLYSTQDKDSLYFDPDKIILCSFPCVATSRDKATKISLLDMALDFSNELKSKPIGQYRGTANKAKKAKFKTTEFKAFTISIGFDGKPTGILTVDIDHVREKYNKTPHEIINLICQFFPVLVGATSIGGDGVFILMRYPKENNLVSVFKAIAEDFDFIIGLEIDFLADLQRLRIDTFDPDVYINWEAGIYERVLFEEETQTPAKQQQDNFNLDGFSSDPAIAFINKGLEVFPVINPLLEAKGLTVSESNSKDEVCCYQAPGHSPRTIVAKWHEGTIFFIIKSSTFAKEWSVEVKGYNAYEFHKILTGYTDFEALRDLSVLGFGKFIEPQIVKQNGNESYSKTLVFLENKGIRLNLLTGVIEVEGFPLNDIHLAKWLTEFSMLSGKNQSRDILLSCIDVITNGNQFHPVLQFVKELKSLPETDFSQPTATDKLIDCFTSSTPKELIKIYLVRWMIGLFDLHILNRMTKLVLILSGAQNSGKTSFAKNILPEPLKQYGKVVEFNQNKMTDSKIALCSILVACFDEFEDILTKSKTLSEFKNLTSSYDIFERRPYRRNHEQMFRSSLIMATTNEKNILNDSTGNTRFLTLDIQAFDLVRYFTIDLNKVWREIYDLHILGQTSVLTDSERALQTNENINFESEDFIVGLIESVFHKDENGFLTSTEILIELEKNTKQPLSIKRIGQALRKMGIERKSKRVAGVPKYGYALKFNFEV